MTTLILGSAKSGKAAEKYLLSKGEKPCIYDDQSEESSSIDIRQLNIKQAVISPGFSPVHSVVRQLQKQNIPIIGELELGLKDLSLNSIGITGTNGKTTVSLLIEHVLNQCNIKAKAIGNIGIPITEYLLTHPRDDFVIIEISSYQLEAVYSKKIDYGVILNIHPHHLDRYNDFYHYANTKLNLLNLIKHKTYVSSQVLNDFPHLRGQNCALMENIDFSYPHLFQENLSAAFSICKMLEVSKDHFLHSLNTFQKPLHRLEWVTNISGIDFYNDSKATNVNAVIRAIESFNRKIILIAGGYDCMGDFTSWNFAMKNKVRQMFVFGESSQRMKRQLRSLNVEIVNSLYEGINKAMQASQCNEVILLSPGCPSFGEYKNYEQRGNAFKQLVKALKERKS